MKAHTTAFKDQIKLLGRELDSKIIYTIDGVETVLSSEELNSVNPHYEGAILKSVMKQLEIDSNVDIPLKTVLKYEFGVKINGEYEYINFGNFIVFKSEKQEDTGSYKITCYDKMLFSMITYEKVETIYPTTVRNYINDICDQLGLTFKNANEIFANSDKEIASDLYAGLGYTYRDVFDELAQVTASTICINEETDELEIRYINDTNDTIDEEFLNDINVNFGEKYGKINSIVLSRSGESDNVYLRDEASVEENGLCELKIIDNQIMNWNNRSEFLPDILEKLNGLEYYLNDFESTGICYYNLCDRYNIKVGEKIYSCIMFNDDILVTQGLEENIYTEMLKQTETDYTKADKTDMKINQVYIIVNKQEQKINLAVETAQEAYDKVEVYNPVLEAEGNSQLSLPDCAGEKLLEFTVDGKSEQKKYTGKNIFDYVTTLKTSTGGLTNTLNPDGSITTTGILNTNYIGICGTQNITDILEDSQTYTAWQENLNGGSNLRLIVYINNKETNTTASYVIIEGVNSKSFIVDKTKYFYTINIQTDTTTNWGTTSRTFTNKYMLVKGTDVTFEPYVGRTSSPNPNYPSEIKNISGIENLFSIDDTTTPTKIIDGEVTITTSAYDPTKFLIKVSKNQPYTLSFINDNASSTYPIRLQVKESDSSGNAGTKIADDTISYTDKHVRTVTPTTEYIIIEMFRGVATNELTTISEIQLEKGLIAHPYMSYGDKNLIIKVVNENLEETISLVNLKNNLHELCSIGNAKDELVVKNGQGTINKKILKLILKGDENWNSTGGGVFWLNRGTYNRNGDFSAISNSYNYSTWENRFNGYTVGLLYLTDWGNSRLFIHDENYSTVDEFKAYLQKRYDAGKPVIIQFELATPETINLGEVSIETIQGDCALTLEEKLDTDMYAKYIKNNPYNEAYSTRLDTKVQIQLSENKIESSVSETILQNTELMQGEIDSLSSNLANNYMTSEEVQNLNNLTNESLAVITNEFKQIQTSTQTQFQAITNILQNGVNLVKTTYTTIDDEGIKIAKSTDSFNSTFDNRGLKLYSYTDLMAVYTNKGAGVTNLLVTGTMDLGYSKIMKVTQNGKKYTGIFFSDAMVQTLEDFVED